MTTPLDEPSLRVERCGTCGARYNVSRLAAGSRFACRRCAAIVTVGAGDGSAQRIAPLPPGPIPFARREARRVLVVAGAVALVAVAPRLATTLTPSNGSIVDLVSLGTVAVAGLLALTMCLMRPGAGWLAMLGSVVVVALLRSHGPDGAALRADASDLPGALAFVLLGTAALRLCGQRDDARGAARPLALGGVALLVSAAAFRVAMGETRPDLLLRLDGLQALLGTMEQGMDWIQDGATHRFALPDLTLAAATALLMLAALLPGRRGGRLGRIVGGLAFALLLHALVSPTVADLFLDAHAGLPPSIGDAIAHVGLDSGLALFLLGTSALAATRASGVRRDTARSGFAHGLAAVVAGGVAWMVFSAEADATTGGDLALLFDRLVTGDVALGARPHAAVVFGLLAVTSGFAAFLPALRRTGPLLWGLGAAVVALAAGPIDLSRSIGGTPRAAMMAIAVIAAGLVVARRGPTWGGPERLGTAAMGLALLGLLAFPADGVIAEGAWIPYPCLLGTALESLRYAPDFGAVLRDEGVMVSTLAALAALLTGVAAASAPRRWVGVPLVIVAVSLALFDPAWHALIAALDAEGGALEAARLAATTRLPGAPVAVLLAGLPLAADVIGGRSETVGPAAGWNR